MYRGESRVGHGLIVRGPNGHLARFVTKRHSRRVDEEQGIYRSEVQDVIGALADIKFDVRRILWYIEGDDEWEEEEEEEDPSGDD